MSSIFFISEYEVLTDSNNFSVVIPAICNKKELLNEYSIKLKFPYFGANWDSLWDLICDFHWIPQKHIHIYHECVTLMPIRDLKIFLKLLIDACKDWDEIIAKTEHFVGSELEMIVIDSRYIAFTNRGTSVPTKEEILQAISQRKPLYEFQKAKMDKLLEGYAEKALPTGY